MNQTPQKPAGAEAFPCRGFESVCGHALGLIDSNREYLQMHLKQADAPTRQALADMAVETARLERAVGELLELAALEQAMPPACGWLDLRSVLAEAEAFREELAQEAGIRLAVEPGDAAVPCTVLGEVEAAESICFHLLSNALHASAPGDAITLALAPEAGGWVLTVADRGCGLPGPTNWQENRRRFLGGAGAGLRLCRGQCARLGWTLTLEENPGGGTLARVHIPAAGQPPLPGRVALGSGQEAPTRLYRLLARERKLL